MGNAVDRARAAQAETEALKVSAQETTAALQETTAELKNLKGELKWLQLHIKREQELALEPKRFRRELIVCAVVAVGATIITLVTTLVLGNILREIAIETLETLPRLVGRVSGLRNRLVLREGSTTCGLRRCSSGHRGRRIAGFKHRQLNCFPLARLKDAFNQDC